MPKSCDPDFRVEVSRALEIIATALADEPEKADEVVAALGVDTSGGTIEALRWVASLERQPEPA